jgi:predicted RNase H-like HicB family nuclease
VAQGDDLAEAKRMAKDAIELWLSVAEARKAKAFRAR